MIRYLIFLSPVFFIGDFPDFHWTHQKSGSAHSVRNSTLNEADKFLPWVTLLHDVTNALFPLPHITSHLSTNFEVV